jgi:lysozyme family protein
MPEAFEQALKRTLAHEGGFVDDADDPGGATNKGISLRFYRQWINADATPDDIRNLTDADIRQLYLQQFWLKGGYDKIADPSLAAKAFDLAVNMGPHQAHLCLQRALRACGFTLDQDGVIGPATLNAIDAADPLMLLAALRSEAAGFYRLLAATGKRSKYLTGWLTRAYS